MNISEEEKLHVRKLLIEGKKILAIKYLNGKFDLALKDAKRMADLIEQDIINDGGTIGNTRNRTLPSLKGCVISKVFSVIGVLLFSISAILFITDYLHIDSGIKVTAVVVSSPSKPVFEYTINGEKYTYESSVSSNPPSYSIGEEVTMYVDPYEPYNILIDTFTDRWLGFTICFSIGVIFLFIGLGSSRFFSRIDNSIKK